MRMNSTRLSFLVRKISNNTRARGNAKLLFKILTRNPIFRTLPGFLRPYNVPKHFPKIAKFSKMTAEDLKMFDCTPTNFFDISRQRQLQGANMC